MPACPVVLREPAKSADFAVTFVDGLLEQAVGINDKLVALHSCWMDVVAHCVRGAISEIAQPISEDL